MRTKYVLSQAFTFMTESYIVWILGRQIKETNLKLPIHRSKSFIFKRYVEVALSFVIAQKVPFHK